MAESTLAPETLSRQTYLAPQKRQHIKENIQSLEWALRGRSMFGGMDMPRDIAFPDHNPPEPEIIRESLEKEQQLLTASTPPEVSSLDKNKLYRRLKDLDALITHDMPTYDMMEQPTMNNVEHHMAWERIHKKHILERRSILRILDTDNDSPFFVSVEQLRTSTAPKGNPRQFFQKFDYIEFQEAQEETLNIVDDVSYTKFLELKLRGWVEMTICKEMGWPREVYNAAMGRWRKSLLDGAYLKFLELQASHRSPSDIQTFLGWDQDTYDAALKRWRDAVGEEETPQEKTTSAVISDNGDLVEIQDGKDGGEDDDESEPSGMGVPETPWFAPKDQHEVTHSKSEEVASILHQRMQLLSLSITDLARMLRVDKLSLGRKLRGKSTLTPKDVKMISGTLDKIERERGYVDPDAIPLRGDPAAAV